jgi:hypothetical protein
MCSAIGEVKAGSWSIGYCEMMSGRNEKSRAVETIALEAPGAIAWQANV